MPIYREIPSAEVEEETKQAAEAALRHGCRVLGFALPPEVRYCRMVTNQKELAQVMAHTPPGSLAPPGYKVGLQPFKAMNDSTHWVIWLAIPQSPHEAAVSTLHELKHLARRRDGYSFGLIGSKAREDEEVGCEAWAKREVERLSKAVLAPTYIGWGPC